MTRRIDMLNYHKSPEQCVIELEERYANLKSQLDAMKKSNPMYAGLYNAVEITKSQLEEYGQPRVTITSRGRRSTQTKFFSPS